ncbi:MAG: beta-ketoacyl synthase N-terminal-like domain-containing protein [Polyangiaceae bacterium]
MTAVLLAHAAISGLGSGSDAVDVGREGEPSPCAIGVDAELSRAGLRRPYVARAALDGEEDRAAALLRHSVVALGSQLDALGIELPPSRTRVFVGTSSGGMSSLMQAVTTLDAGSELGPELAEAATYFGPLAVLTAHPRFAALPVVQVLSACSSSTIALGLGLRALERGEADFVIAGGYDGVSPFVAAGFEALGATSPRPRPFRRDRDGLCLGEGAALLLLSRDGPASLGALRGFSMSADAHHVTQPHPEGRGLSAAAGRALEDAGVDRVDLVSAHGTATPLNDEVEARVIASCGLSATACVHAFKGSIGHTLGAAGALESLAALEAMRRGVLPASTGPGDVIDALEGRVLDRNRAGRSLTCLKLSAAFGGANAALVWEVDPRSSGAVARHGTRRPPKEVHVLSPVQLLSAAFDHPPGVVLAPERLRRFDALSLLAISGAANAMTVLDAPLPRDTAVVVGTSAATLEPNAQFERTRVRRGAEPRRFPATTPNLAACAVSIAFGLTGPAFAVGASDAAASEAAVVAADLVASGDAPAAVVVHLEWAGDFVASVFRARGRPVPRTGASACILGQGGLGRHGPVLDRGLLWRRWRDSAGCGAAQGLADAVAAG